MGADVLHGVAPFVERFDDDALQVKSSVIAADDEIHPLHPSQKCCGTSSRACLTLKRRSQFQANSPGTLHLFPGSAAL
jgi:hypothetical protein